MLSEHFLGRNPSHFLRVNPIVKAFIISECFYVSGWNLIIPLFAVFVVENVTQGSIETAAAGMSTYLIIRVIFELITGRYFSKVSESIKLFVIITGLIIMSVAFAGFAFSTNIVQVFIFYIILGVGVGLFMPTKNSVFSVHLDKNKETTEWSIADATAAISMALATALGGFVAANYGFRTLFLIGSAINFLSIIPYILYLRKHS